MNAALAFLTAALVHESSEIIVVFHAITASVAVHQLSECQQRALCSRATVLVPFIIHDTTIRVIVGTVGSKQQYVPIMKNGEEGEFSKKVVVIAAVLLNQHVLVIVDRSDYGILRHVSTRAQVSTV